MAATTTFLLTKDLDGKETGNYEREGIIYTTKTGLSMTTTPIGVVVAFQVYERLVSEKEKHPSTIVPGIYKKELDPTKEGLSQWEVEPIPKKHRKTVTEILKKQGYEGPLNFWRAIS